MKYRGVFFDFDYTLGDSTIPITIGFQQGFSGMGLPKPTSDQVRPTIGMTLQDAYTMLTGDEAPAHRQEFFDRFQQAVGQNAVGPYAHVMEEKTVLFPGVKELLSELRSRQIKVAIVSTKISGIIKRILECQNLSVGEDVALIIGGREVKRHKPDPEGLNLALNCLGLRREEVLFCGDTVIDAQTAQNGGVDFCAVLNGTTPAEAFACYPSVHIADDLKELKEWIFAEINV